VSTVLELADSIIQAASVPLLGSRCTLMLLSAEAMHAVVCMQPAVCDMDKGRLLGQA
jgi:hypothetical protein